MKSFILNITSVTLKKELKDIEVEAKVCFYWSKTNCYRLTQLCKHVVILDQPTPISHQTKNSSRSFTDPKAILNVCDAILVILPVSKYGEIDI